MASFVNVGAKFNYGRNEWIPTKASLKATIKDDPTKVLLCGTALFGTFKEGDSVTTDKLDTGVKYSVTGPNPYTKRDWFATVEKLADGRITVK